MFEKFIQYYKALGLLHPKFEFEIRTALKHYESKSEEVKAKFQRIKEKYNWDTCGDYEFDDEFDIHLEFWRGSGNFDTGVCLASVDGVGDNDAEFGSIITEHYSSFSYEDTAAFNKEMESIEANPNEFPPVREYEYENFSYKIHHDIFYAWFANLWQEAKGYESQMPAKIIQNNSVDMFSLNDFLWEGYSKFNLYREDELELEPVEKVYQRDLTIEELFLRADSEWDHWMSENTNFWRYFEKDGQFVEIGFYYRETVQRSGKLEDVKTAPIENLKRWKERKEVLKFMNEFVHQKTLEGWMEKLRPYGLPKKIHDDALEFDVNFNWNGKEKDFSEAAISNFEEKFGFDIPSKYRAFLGLIKGKKQLGKSHFMTSNTTAKKIAKIYSLNEIETKIPNESKANLEYLKIMETEDFEYLCINVNPSKDKNGRIFLQNLKDEFEEITNDFEDFLSLLVTRY